MARRVISTLPLASFYKTRLNNSGYCTVADLTGVLADKLSKDTGLSTEDTASILDVVSRSKSSNASPESALSLLKKEESTLPIVTFCERLDAALGGGLQCGRLTEVCGVPGVGKTQLCIQLACDVQIPAIFGGLEGEVVYIDTEGGFIIDRVVDIVKATVQHCQYIAARENDEDISRTVSQLTVEKLLSGIHSYSCYDNKQLLATINLLPNFLQENKKVKLVILDSVAFHFRHDFDDLSLRTRILSNLAQTLIQMAAQFDIAVVVTNQMTTKVRQGPNKGSHLVPSLGESWGHACTTRLILQWEGPDRVAWLYKSPSQRQTKVPYQITKDGIRDALFKESVTNQSVLTVDSDAHTSEEKPPKRQRTS